MNDSLGDYLHFISDAPTDRLPDKPTKDNITATLLKKKECESRAMKLLEFLIEGKVRSEVFLRCINFLNRSYYQDVVEERSIMNLCGYCLCNNTIPKMTAKRFSIDSKNNKVYDITNRKKHCSNFCYKASLHIEKQIDDSPLWLRSFEVLPTYTLLPVTDKGLPGDDVNSDTNILDKEEVQFDSSYSFAEASLHEMTNADEKAKQEDNKKAHTPTKEPPPHSQTSSDYARHVLKQPQPKTTKRNRSATLKKYILEWLSLDTYVFLFGRELVRERALKLNLPIPSSEVLTQRKLNQLCRKLELVDCRDKDKMTFHQELKPVPTYSQLKKDSKDISVKVRSFYSGETYDVSKSEDGDSLTMGESPNLVRQEIFLTNINTAIKTLVEHLGVESAVTLTKIELLVRTFSLHAYSVVFQPVEWSLIALILIKMLSIRDAQIKELFQSKEFSGFLQATVLSLRRVEIMINDLLKSIEDIDMFLINYLNVERCSDEK
ncbi:hypothetical protein PPYR_08593 [Photinus pyralis]|uniref:RNA polymerase II subunit B1 CTD phosphatase RPAP2 homolog n=1 Tax=Photinus pyralis TaxID=7054 RepID=A0A1Y1MXG2_PHOPY|nr:putative RNA polymerase II subunit B1 CTD phosphatase RPAP2 [Photinus pyralis]KAB0797600.1 hypothetical protein PPYR_08593 [Photinus pyralis]